MTVLLAGSRHLSPEAAGTLHPHPAARESRLLVVMQSLAYLPLKYLLPNQPQLA